MITNIFIYKIVFAIEILVAEFLFTFKLRKRKLFALRLFGCAVVLIAFAALFPTPINNAWYTSLTFFLIFAVSIPLLAFCYGERWINLIFCAIAAYTLQHFSYELASVMLSLVSLGNTSIFGIYSNTAVDIFAFDQMSVLYMLIYLLCYVGSYWAFFSIYGGRIRKGSDMSVKSVSLLFLIGAGLMTDIIINSFVVYGEREFNSVAVTSVSNMLCCILLMYALFSLVYSKELQNEMEVVNHLYREEKEQYALLKENMDIIDMKCHDMRHQIREIGKTNRISDETIAEMEKSINMYDAVVKTGNETVDIIMTEKSLRCKKSDIILSCIIDGEALSFLPEGELFSLLGNALDNAIEATLSVPNKSERVVGVKIFMTDGFVTLNVQNSYGGSLEFDGAGLPVTTKADKTYHGFGIKSMKYITEKYGGDMFVEAKDGIFKLNILLPKPQDDE